MYCWACSEPSMVTLRATCGLGSVRHAPIHMAKGVPHHGTQNPAKLVLEPRAQGLSARAIAAGHDISRNSIAAVFEAVNRAHIKWDDLAELSEAKVYQVVFPYRGAHQSVYAQTDWDTVPKELARVGVTLKLLHSEYIDQAIGSAGDEL